MVGRQRNGSASSGVATGPTNTPGNSQPSSPASVPPRRKKGGGLLAMLGCCGVPDNAQAVEQNEENLPSHKLANLPPRPTTASRSAAMNQSGNEEMTGVRTQFYEKEPNMKVNHSADAPARKTSTKESSAQDHSTVGGGDEDSKQTTLVGAAGPVVTVDPPASGKGSDDVPVAGTEKDGDGDVEMPDAAEAPPRATANPAVDKMYTGTRPPPPPPGPIPPVPSTSTGNTPAPEPIVIAEEPQPPQKSLLPPIRPEHRGRKCLVLDLDETLVHSSFKVWAADLTSSSECTGLTLIEDTASSRHDHPRRDRGQLSQCLCHQAAWSGSIHEESGGTLRDRCVHRVGLKGEKGAPRPTACIVSLTIGCSMVIPSWISWTSTTSSTTGYSGKVAIITRATMSKICRRSDAI
jgi:carboxy-terminal domain RNA polymerase II polypeptide A small phosphatase